MHVNGKEIANIMHFSL